MQPSVVPGVLLALLLTIGGCGHRAAPAPPDPPPAPAVEVLATDRAMRTETGTGSRAEPVVFDPGSRTGQPALILYGRCLGPSDLQVTDSGPDRLTWTVKCDGLTSRMEVFTDKFPLRASLTAAPSTRWSFVLATPRPAGAQSPS